jgi:chitin disaccharide deacetylase
VSINRVQLAPPPRRLIVTADDFGIGPGTSEGILELAARGRITWTVLLVNSPYAVEAVRAWRRAGEVPALGWHPTLTLDAPVLPPGAVSSLVGRDGRFHSISHFLSRLIRGSIRTTEVRAELHAQYARFRELVGRPPPVVNAHHHLHIFPPVGALLRAVLASQSPLPHLRRVCEPWRTLFRVPRARLKRIGLTVLGRSAARAQARAGFPGNDCLAAPTALPHLRRCAGQIVELVCHPGHPDPTLTDRDTLYSDVRVSEFRQLANDAFPAACRDAGLTLVPPDTGTEKIPYEIRHAA